MTETHDAATEAPAAPETLPRTMQAWLQHRYGGPETVGAEQIAVPQPREDEVLLRVRATALNAADARLLRGEPLLVRPFFGLRRPKHAGRGMDVAGTVVAAGDDVSDFAVGDEVVGELPGGGLAEFVVAPVARLVVRPPALAPASAAILPMAGGTAWQALDLGRVSAGQRILVIGASGGVGTYVVQLAADRGAEVWALCGERSRELVESLGAQRTFDYERVQPGSPELPTDGFDAIIDIAGTAPLGRLKRLLREGGCLVSVAGGHKSVLGPIPRILWGLLSWIGSKRRFAPLAAVAKTDVLRELVAAAASGRLVPVIERTFSLAESRDAIAHIDAGHTVGKIVVAAPGR